MINVRIRKKILDLVQPVLSFKDSGTKGKGRTTTSYWKILKLSVPVGLEGVFQTSFSLIDQIIVGRLGADAVAGVGLSNSFSFIVLLIYSAIGTGTGVLVARAFGRKDMEEVSATAAAGHVAAALLGISTAIPMALFPETILRWMGAQGDVASQATGYLQLFAASTPLIVMSAVTTATFRSLNDTRTPMIITIGAVAFNTLIGFFFGPWNSSVSKAWSSRRRRGHSDGSSYPVPRFINYTLSKAEGNEMAVAVAILPNKRDFRTAFSNDLPPLR